MEVVVVVLILAVLAAVAVPAVLHKSDEAIDNGLRQTLAVIRDAVALYAANNSGAWPGSSNGTQATFKSNVDPYLRGPFPVGPVGPAKGDNRVRMRSNGVPLSGPSNPGRAWRYDYTTGELIYNYNGVSHDGVTKYDEF